MVSSNSKEPLLINNLIAYQSAPSPYTFFSTMDDVAYFKNYKYSGEDRGITYKYFYNPVAIKLVNMLPTWIAPNLITFMGFFCVILGFVLTFSLYGTEFKGHVPWWFLILYSALLFAYRMLDEMDGKQARRTANCSPVGVMMDHFTDYYNGTMLCLPLLKFLQLDDPIKIFILLLMI